MGSSMFLGLLSWGLEYQKGIAKPFFWCQAKPGWPRNVLPREVKVFFSNPWWKKKTQLQFRFLNITRRSSEHLLSYGTVVLKAPGRDFVYLTCFFSKDRRSIRTVWILHPVRGVFWPHLLFSKARSSSWLGCVTASRKTFWSTSRKTCFSLSAFVTGKRIQQYSARILTQQKRPIFFSCAKEAFYDLQSPALSLFFPVAGRGFCRFSSDSFW